MSSDMYLAGKPYVVSYINTDGKTITKNYTPEEEMNIVQIIDKIKSENDDFFKLYSIVEDKKEEMKQQLEDGEILTEGKDDKADIDTTLANMKEKDFKRYVEQQLEDVYEYIKFVRTSKINKSKQWGAYIYGKDIEANDGTILNGFKWFVPYDEDKSFVDNFIELDKEEIKQFYDSKDLKLKTESLGDRYEVWETYFNEDGTTTTEYVASFDNYADAERFADGLNEDPDCQAWVEDKEELNESKDVTDNIKEKIKQMIKTEKDTYELQEYIMKQFEENNISEEEKEQLLKFVQENTVYECMDCGNEFEIDQATITDTFGTPGCPQCGSGDVAGLTFLDENKKLIEAYEVHNELNPKLWNNETKELLPEVEQSLLEISEEFIKYIDIPLDVVDAEFIGSNASYNYNEQSDIDLHLIVNFDLNYVDNEILQTLFNAKKNSFNDNYNLEIKGIPVELYIQDINAGNSTLAIYSVTNGEWIKEPEPITFEVPDITEELKQREQEIDNVLAGDNEQAVKDLLNDIYMERKNGLAVDGETSKGNVLFKALRNEGYLELLRQKYYDLRSEQLSINESKEYNHVASDWEKLQKDPMIGAKEHWSDAYWQEVVDYGKSLTNKKGGE